MKPNGPVKERFGAFLVRKGVLTRDELLAALRVQQDRQTPLVNLALDSGLLDEPTRDRLIEMCRRREMNFEECAVADGVLGCDDILDLIRRQRQTRPRLGELLRELGMVSNEKLASMLREFLLHRQTQTA